MFRNKISGNIALYKIFLVQNIILEIQIGLNSLNNYLSQGTSHLGNSRSPVLIIHDHLHDHRIIIRGDLVAIKHCGIDPDTISSRQVDIFNGSRTGHKVPGRILCIDPALDGMASHNNILLFY